MSFSALVTIADMLFMPIAIIGLILLVRQGLAVKGSRQRYVVTNLTLVILVIQALCLIVSCLGDLRKGDHLGVVASAFALTFTIWNIWRLLQDDNWFNDQFKKLKRSLKNLRTNLSTWSPALPATS